ncbi:MAG: YezD family protein [Pirellulales bacterium]
MSSQERTAGSSAADGAREAEIQQIREALRGLRFGAVTIIVQDGVVIQIDRTEKRRLRRSASDPPPPR